MYYCGWCKTRTQQTVFFPHNGWDGQGIGCSQENRTDLNECTECGWEKELLCSVCEGGVTEVEFSIYNNAEETPQSQAMFEGWLKTPELAGILERRMSNPEEFEEDFKAGLWNRGSICRALADKGITQNLINFMKS